MNIKFLSMVFLVLNINLVKAETVDVKYHGPVKIDTFKCEPISRSSFVNRVCYAPSKKYMIIQLDSIYYHYCSIDAQTVQMLLNADSMGRYYNSNIRSRGQTRGPFDCRDHPVPQF